MSIYVLYYYILTDDLEVKKVVAGMFPSWEALLEANDKLPKDRIGGDSIVYKEIHF